MGCDLAHPDPVTWGQFMGEVHQLTIPDPDTDECHGVCPRTGSGPWAGVKRLCFRWYRFQSCLDYTEDPGAAEYSAAAEMG